MRPVAETYRWTDGQVMTFDAAGDQLADLQGPATPVLAERIRAASTPTTRWYGWDETGPLEWRPPAALLSQG